MLQPRGFDHPRSRTRHNSGNPRRYPDVLKNATWRNPRLHADESAAHQRGVPIARQYRFHDSVSRHTVRPRLLDGLGGRSSGLTGQAGLAGKATGIITAGAPLQIERPFR